MTCYDLSNLDLRGLEGTGIDFSNSYFRVVDFRGIDFLPSRLEGSSVNNYKISGAYFSADLNPDEILLSVDRGTRMRYQK